MALPRVVPTLPTFESSDDDEVAAFRNPKVAKFRNLCAQRKLLRLQITQEAEESKPVESKSLHLDHPIKVGAAITAVRTNIMARNAVRAAMNDEARAADQAARLKDTARLRDEAKAMVDRFKRAKHLLPDDPADARNDVGLERRLWQATDIIASAPAMADLNPVQSRGVAEAVPPRSPGTEASRAASKAYVALRRGEEEQFRMEAAAKEAAVEAFGRAEATEMEIRELIDQINAPPGAEHPLPVEKRAEARARLSKLEAASKVQFQEAKRARVRLEELGLVADANQTRLLGDGPIPVWILGVPVATDTSRAAGGACYHGALVTGKPLHKEIWCDLGGGNAVEVTAGGYQLSQKKGGADLGGATHPFYEVSGSGTKAVNGNYSRTGERCGFACYSNANGIVLYRATILESPESGISSLVSGGTTDLVDFPTTWPIESDPLGRDFEKMRDIGAMLGRMCAAEARKRRQDLAKANEDREVARFRAKLEKVSKSLTEAEDAVQLQHQPAPTQQTCVEGGATSQSDVTSHSTCPVLNIPNITQQAPAEDARALSATIDRVVPTSIKANQVPPLCKDWVLLRCTLSAAECQSRHYYISLKERDKWVGWRLRKEQELDVKALEAVLQREQILDQLHEITDQANQRYIEEDGIVEINDGNKREEGEYKEEGFEDGSTVITIDQRCETQLASIVAPILVMLDRLRLATVEAAEAIIEWRSQVALRQRAVAALTRSKGANKTQRAKVHATVWISTIETEGRKLHDAIPPLRSKYKKYQRGAIPARRVRVTKYLGVFETRQAAEDAYEAAKPRVALERRVLVQKLPPRVERETYGGVNIIETRGSLPLTQLEDLVRARIAADLPPPPSYFYEQQNYLVKMATDLNWLAEVVPLRLHVGFSLRANPLLVAPNVFEDQDDNEVDEEEQWSSSLMERQTNSGSPSSLLLQEGPSVNDGKKRLPPLPDPPTSFGTPSSRAGRHRDGKVISWHGSMKLLGSTHGTESGATHVLDVVRIKKTLAVIDEEIKRNQSRTQQTEANEMKKDDNDNASDSDKDEEDEQGDSSHRLDKAKTRVVWAVYEDVQAKVMIRQERGPLHGVIPGVFCRPDYGKWKGVGHIGPALRTYLFNRKLREEGDKRKTSREKLAGKLRREAARGLIRMRPTRMLGLLEEANALRGAGRLVVDAQRAKTLLDQRYRAEVLGLHISRMARGIAVRLCAKARRVRVKEALAAKRSWRLACRHVAENFVRTCGATAVIRAARKLNTPSHIATTRVDGVRCYVLVYSLDHRRVCRPAEQHWVPRRDTHMPEAPPVPSRFARPVFARDQATGDLRLDYSPLVDDAVTENETKYYASVRRPPECLRVSVYDPATQETCSMEFTEAMLRRTLIDAELTKSLDELYPDPQERDEIPKLARLARVPGDSPNWWPRDRWEPLREERVLADKRDDALRLKLACERAATKAMLAACRAADTRDAADRACFAACMHFADAESHVYETWLKYQQAVVETANAIAWSKAEIDAFDDADVTKHEDWRQVYDPFENGNDWMTLRRKRARQRQNDEALKVEIRARYNMCEAMGEAQTARHASTVADLQLEQAWQALERATMDLESADCAANTARRRRITALDAAISQLTLTQVAKFGKRHGCRELVFRSREWTSAIGSAARAVKPLRRFWNAAFRRICTVRLTSRYALVAKRLPSTKRFLITLSQDPVEGTCLFVAERAGADPGEREELVVSPVEVAEIVRAAGRPDLAIRYVALGSLNLFFKPTVFPPATCVLSTKPRSLATVSRARKKRAQEIAEILYGSLTLDVFNGALNVRGLNILRRRATLERRLCHGDADRVATMLDAGDTVEQAQQKLPSNMARVGRPCGRWWIDAAVAGRSFLRGGLIFAKVIRIADREAFARVYDAWGDLRIETYETKTGESHDITVPLINLVESFLRDESYLAIAQMLCAVRLNRYPAPLIAAVFERLDLRLPGERAWWRRPLANERPHLIFCEDLASAKYRGPIYSRTTTISQKVGLIRIFADATGGYQLMFSVAADQSNQLATYYRGPPLTLDLSVALLLDIVKGTARVARAYNDSLSALKQCEHRIPIVDDERYVPNTSLVVNTEQRHELCEFLVQRLELMDSEDEATGRPTGFHRDRRLKQIETALEALRKFEQWAAATFPPLREPGPRALACDLRAALRERQRVGCSIRPSLALCPLCRNRPRTGFAFMGSWTFAGGHYTAQVRLNVRGEFVVSLSRETEYDTRIRLRQRELADMEREDGASRVAHKFRKCLELDSRLAHQQAIDAEADAGAVLEIAKALRRSSARSEATTRKRKIKRQTEATAATQIIRRALCLSLSRLFVDDAYTVLRFEGGRAQTPLPEWLWSTVRVVVNRVVILAGLPWIVRCKWREGNISFDAYEPSSAAQLTTMASGNDLVENDTLHIDEPDAKMERSLPSPREETLPPPTKAESTPMEPTQNTTTNPKNTLSVMMRSGARMAMTTWLFQRPGKVVNAAAMRVAADLDIEMSPVELRAATLKSDMREIMSASERSNVLSVELTGNLGFGGPRFPPKTRLYVLDSEEGRWFNERATHLCARYATDEDEAERLVHGDAVIVCPGNQKFDDVGAILAAKLLKEDVERQAARAAYRAARTAMWDVRVARVEAARERWMRRAFRRVVRMHPWLERTCRAREPTAATPEIRAILELRNAAYAVGDHSDPFDRRVKEIRTSQDCDGVYDDLHGLEDTRLHPWLLWRAVVVSHACQCQLPVAACTVLECTAARAQAFAAGAIFEPAVLDMTRLFCRQQDGQDDGRWTTVVADCVERMMDERARGRAFYTHYLAAPAVQQPTTEREDALREANARFVRPPKGTIRKKEQAVYRQLAKFAVSLLSESKPDAPRHTAVRRCLVSKSEASIMGRSAFKENCSMGRSALTVPRAQVAMLVSRDSQIDAHGVATGASQEMIMARDFRGNDTFFNWLLGRVSIDLETQTPYSIGMLHFDAIHGRAVARLLSEKQNKRSLCHIAIKQPIPMRAPISQRADAQVLEIFAALGKILKFEDPGLVVEAIILDAPEALRATELVLSPADLRMMLPNDKKVEAHGGTQPLRFVTGTSHRADLAAWLLRRAGHAFELREGSLRLRSRHRVLAAIIAYPPGLIRRGDGTRRRHSLSLPEIEPDSDDEEVFEREVAEELSRLEAYRCLRDKARQRLCVIAREWPAMLAEDSRSLVARPLLATPISFVRALNDAFYKAAAESVNQSNHMVVETKAQCELVVKRLLLYDNCAGLNAEGRVNEINEELDILVKALVLPVGMDDVSVYWYNTRSERVERQAERRRRQAELAQIRKDFLPSSLPVDKHGMSTPDSQSTLRPSRDRQRIKNEGVSFTGLFSRRRGGAINKPK